MAQFNPMRTYSAFFAITAFILLSAKADPLPRSTPEAEGVSSRAILDFIEAADQNVDTMNSFMLLRHGKVVAEGWWTPYAADTPHVLYSLSKSFTSTAVGLAIHEGKLSLDDEVLKFFPNDAPDNPANNLKSMRLHDLLRMSTGHQTEPQLSDKSQEPWTKLFLAHPVAFKPGTHFLYNTAGTYMQSAIVQKVTGETVLDFLNPRLFTPLGIQNPTWGTSPQGISLGGYGLNLRTEDIAKFGQLYLQKGKWNGKEIIPESWVEAATKIQTSNGSNPKSDWDQGYGYQFWRCRNGAYRGDGAFGQYCIVMPRQDAVVAITSGTRDMQAVLNILWDKLLPAFSSSALASNSAEDKALKQKLSALSVRHPDGAATSHLASEVAGKQYNFPSNSQNIEAIQLEQSGNGPALNLRINGARYHLPCGYRTWKNSKAALGNLKEQPVSASGAWSDENTYVAKLCFYETPTYITLKLSFLQDRLTLNSEYNVAFGPTRQPELIGALEK
jgi:CubicO group peptidase (beta-lactamase class C family)